MIFILTDAEMKKTINEYKRGNVHSRMEIWFDITIDNEVQRGSGLLDDFELHNGFAQDAVWMLPHFEFFRNKYLRK